MRGGRETGAVEDDDDIDERGGEDGSGDAHRRRPSPQGHDRCQRDRAEDSQRHRQGHDEPLGTEHLPVHDEGEDIEQGEDGEPGLHVAPALPGGLGTVLRFERVRKFEPVPGAAQTGFDRL